MQITSEFDQDIESFKEMLIKLIHASVEESGYCPPEINILCLNTNYSEKQLGLVEAQCPPELFSGAAKDYLAKTFIPNTLKKLEKDGLIPICFSMMSEGWARQIPENVNINTLSEKEYKKLPKNEIVGLILETKLYTESINFYKKGIKNKEGVVIKNATLEEMPSAGKITNAIGRFAGLFKENASQN